MDRGRRPFGILPAARTRLQRSGRPPPGLWAPARRTPSRLQPVPMPGIQGSASIGPHPAPHPSGRSGGAILHPGNVPMANPCHPELRQLHENDCHSDDRPQTDDAQIGPRDTNGAMARRTSFNGTAGFQRVGRKKRPVSSVVNAISRASGDRRLFDQEAASRSFGIDSCECLALSSACMSG